MADRVEFFAGRAVRGPPLDLGEDNTLAEDGISVMGRGREYRKVVTPLKADAESK